MIKELTQFVNELPVEFKSLGAKPKYGLHLLLKLGMEGNEEALSVQSVEYEFFLRKNKEELTPFLKKCVELQELSWTLDYEKKPFYQKCFDLPEKGILTISPFSFSVKKKSLKGGSKYIKDKRKINDRIERYFLNTQKLITCKKGQEYNQLLFNYLLEWEGVEQYLKKISAFSQLGDEDHVVFYLDIPTDMYDKSYTIYLDSYLYNSKRRFYKNGEELGVSNFFNGFNDSKLFLKHQTSPFEYSGLVNKAIAKSLKEFKDILGREILPNPLPVFVYKDELGESVSLFKRAAEDGISLGYQEIVEQLYKKHSNDFGNYYLLFYQRGEIKDFDFISKFEYELRNEKGDQWSINDLFEANYQRKLQNVFDLQYAVLLPVFNNALIVKTKSGSFQYRYFDEIDAAYCKSDTTYLQVMTYRKAFYDFIYKSKRQAVPQHAFHAILQASVLDDLRLDEYKNRQHSQERNIRQKLNIWFSLSENFNINHKNEETMASKLKAHRAFMRALAKGEASIQSDDEYAFAVGQVVYYLLSKSNSADKSYKRLESFLQQAHAKELNKAVARLFDTYKHENFSTNFRAPFAEVMDYETTANVRDYLPTVLAGVFSKNELFSDQEKSAADLTVLDNEVSEN